MLAQINYSNLVRFSIPSILAAMVEPLASVVDTAIIGRFSTEMLAALAICTVIFNSLSWIFNFLIHTSTQKIADFSAQQDERLLASRVFICLSLALIISFITVTVMYLFKDQLYFLAGAHPDQTELADQYYLVRIFGHVFSVLFMTFLAVVRGMAFVKEAFIITVFSTGMNIVLSMLFLYQLNLGLKGIALGTVLSHFLGVIFCIWIIYYRKKGLWKLIITAKPEKGEWIHFGKNSLDVFGRSFSLTSSFFLATRYSSLLGHQYLAAHQILLQLWLFCSFFIDGLASSANILMAYYFGSGEIEKSRKIVGMFIKISALAGVCFMAAYIFAGKFILGLFTYDLEVIKICLLVLPIIYSSQIISCIAFIYDGVLFGLEKFSYLRKHMLIGVFLVFLPISSISIYREVFIYIWMGLVCLNIYRVLASHSMVKKELF